jgi:hypothetical protein
LGTASVAVVNDLDAFFVYCSAVDDLNIIFAHACVEASIAHSSLNFKLHVRTHKSVVNH